MEEKQRLKQKVDARPARAVEREQGKLCDSGPRGEAEGAPQAQEDEAEDVSLSINDDDGSIII